MRAKYLNILFFVLTFILLTFSLNAQNKTVSILLNNERVDAQVENNQIVSVDKEISIELLQAIRNPVALDAKYYKEINDILAGKYGTFYADIIKRELIAAQTEIANKGKEKLPYTAVVKTEDISVSFVSKTAKLEGKSVDKLVELADKLRNQNINFILLEGHKPTNNISDYILTTNRVNACKDYLVFKGIDANKIKTKILLTNSDLATSETVKISVN